MTSSETSHGSAAVPLQGSSRGGWAVAAAVRFAVALLLFGAGGLLFRLVDPHGMAPPTWAIVAWTILVAVILWGLRHAIDRVVDRLRFGRGGAGHDSIRSLLQRLATTVPVDEVAPRLAESLGRTVHSSRTEVRIALDDGQQWFQVWPQGAPARGEPLTLQIRHLGDSVGQIELDAERSWNSYGQRLLADIRGPAGLAMSTVKLTWELRRRVADLQVLNEKLRTSQTRLIDARTAEQRRLQSEVNELVLPHVDTVATTIAAASSPAGALPPDGHSAVPGINEALKELSVALDSLRLIARGIFPPRLGDDSLRVALESWCGLAGVRATVRVIDVTDALHGAPEVETCLYFCLVSTLRALASAGATHQSVGVEVSGGHAHFRLAAAAVSTLAEDVAVAARDRVEAFGGDLQISSLDCSIAVAGRVPLTETNLGGLAVTGGSPSTDPPPGGTP